MGKEKPTDREKIENQAPSENPILDSRFFIEKAESLRLQGLYEKAIDTLRNGLGKMPDALPGRLLLGRCFLEKGMIPEAREELETVAKGIEECLPVYKMLSEVYLQEKEVDKALEVLRQNMYFQAAEEAVSKKMTPLERDLLHRDSHPPFATPPFFGIPPAPPAASAGSPRKPARESRRVQEEDPGAKAVIQTDTLAEIYIKQGHLDRALSVYQEILARDPENTAIRGKCESLKNRMKPDRKAEGRKKIQARLERWLAIVASRGGSAPS